MHYGSTDTAAPATSLGFTPKKRDWRARLFDRLAGAEAGADLSDAQKSGLSRQGLLQLGVGLLQNNNFAQGLGQGLQGGLLAMNEGADQIRNNQYQKAIQARMMGNMDRNQRIEDLRGKLSGADGQMDEAAFRQYAALDPEGAKAYRDAISPRVRYQTGQLTTPGGSLPYFYDPENPTGAFDLGGSPLYGGNQPTGGMPSGGAQRQVLDNAFFRSQEQAESGGDPFAVSPKGARGPMQVMPSTAAAPGFGMSPLPAGATPEQNRAFGQDYMRRITEQVGGDRRLGLAAYNWGIGNVQRLQQQGASPDQIIAAAPQETRDYIQRVLGGSPQVASADPFAGRPGFVPAKKTGAEWAPLTPEQVAAAGLPSGTVAQRNASTGQIQTIRLPPASAGGAAGKPLTMGTVNKLTSDAGKLSNLTELSARFDDAFAGNVRGGNVENMLGRVGGERFGVATPGQADWWQQYDRYKGEVRNELYGASLTDSEKAAFEAADITPNMDGKRVRANLKKQSEVIEKALRRQGRVWAAQGYNRDAIMEAIGVPLEAPGKAPAKPAGRPALPPGFSWED